jgi:hypothetical protein
VRERERARGVWLLEVSWTGKNTQLFACFVTFICFVRWWLHYSDGRNSTENVLFQECKVMAMENTHWSTKPNDLFRIFITYLLLFFLYFFCHRLSFISFRSVFKSCLTVAAIIKLTICHRVLLLRTSSVTRDTHVTINILLVTIFC